MPADKDTLLQRAREMRHHMTKEECLLWFSFLKGLPCTVHRQKVIGNYIVDFYIAKKKLVIELDGSQHFEEDGLDYDLERDAFLQRQGFTVLRYANSDVNQQFQNVCDDIWQHVFG